MITYIVRVSLRALAEVLIDATTYFKATLEHFSALVVVVLVFVQCYGNLQKDEFIKVGH